jgi:hypothetical protein
MEISMREWPATVNKLSFNLKRLDRWSGRLTAGVRAGWRLLEVERSEN